MRSCSNRDEVLLCYLTRQVGIRLLRERILPLLPLRWVGGGRHVWVTGDRGLTHAILFLPWDLPGSEDKPG